MTSRAGFRTGNGGSHINIHRRIPRTTQWYATIHFTIVFMLCQGGIVVRVEYLSVDSKKNCSILSLGSFATASILRLRKGCNHGAGDGWSDCDTGQYIENFPLAESRDETPNFLAGRGLVKK
jgi:hypothetical protein